MGGMYFSDKLLFSKGNALIPVEVAAQDRRRRQPVARKIRNTRSKKKKTNMSKNKRSVVIKASKSRGVINAININIGGKEKKSEDIAPPRNFSQSFAPTIYQAPQVRDGDGRGGFVLDETVGERNKRRENSKKRKDDFHDEIMARLNKLQQSDGAQFRDAASGSSPVVGEARDFIAKPKPVIPAIPGIAGGQPEATPVRRKAATPKWTTPARGARTERSMRDTFEQKERLTLQRQMTIQANQIEEEKRRKAQAERLKSTPRNSPNDGEMRRRREWFGTFEDRVRPDSPRRSPRIRETRVAEVAAEVDLNLQNPYGTAAAATVIQSNLRGRNTRREWLANNEAEERARALDRRQSFRRSSSGPGNQDGGGSRLAQVRRVYNPGEPITLEETQEGFNM